MSSLPRISCIALLAIAVGASSLRAADPAPTVIQLWPGTAPEKKATSGRKRDVTKPTDGKPGGKSVIRLGNVSQPTITIYTPPAGKANCNRRRRLPRRRLRHPRPGSRGHRNLRVAQFPRRHRRAPQVSRAQACRPGETHRAVAGCPARPRPRALPGARMAPRSHAHRRPRLLRGRPSRRRRQQQLRDTHLPRASMPRTTPVAGPISPSSSIPPISR